MRNFWLIAKHEYRRMVLKRRFLIITLAIPIGMAVLIAFSIAVAISDENNAPIGYVDLSNRLDIKFQSDLSDPEDRVQIIAFTDEETALSALKREDIQAFFIIPPTYPETLETDLYYLKDPPDNDAWGDFDDFIRLNLAGSLPNDVRDRILDGPSITIKDVTSNRSFNEDNIINVILPVVASFFFLFATMSGSGYMLQVVADEKENRMMEVMLTTMTPGQLIGGKAVGLLGASLTQLGIYVIAAVAGIVIAAPYVPQLQQTVVPWVYLGVMAVFFIPAYGLISAMMMGIGGAVTELQQGQQMAGILNLLFILPMMILPILFENPNSPVMIFFTLFPTTSFLTISLRWGLGTVPTWQLGISWVILVSTTIFAVWAATRVFRAGMLRYGQPLTLKTALAAIRGR